MVSAASSVAAGSTEPCDRCGAAAKLALVLASGRQLTFCGHHANGYTETILATAESVFLEPGFEWRGAQVESDYIGAHRADAYAW
ncbi:hypothetical protein HC031_15560 [Planosporangium thailandense]|uniref:DUF7455 domain-containing protein n=2 Tax=Planosporangium thailandense TaxID=765197 RepID=A0ABX0Y183_9ACTN|nr:hypothetical protein [Planosporangium thailandense]